MATKFMRMPQIGEVKEKEVRKTVLSKAVGFNAEGDLCILKFDTLPTRYQNVMHLWKDKEYGDIFKCWDEDENDATIYFGTAGDEFNQ